jgi:hypothetical protein
LADWSRAQSLASEAIGILDDIGDRQEAEVARALAAHAYFYSGDFAGADTILHDLLRSARDRGHEQHMAWASFLLARTQLALGHGARALPMLLEAHATLLRVEDYLSLSVCEGLLSRALWGEGAHAEAGRVARSLLARLDAGLRARVPHAVEGYDGLCEYLFEAAPTGAARDERTRIARVHRYLRSHARTFPLGMPSMHRSRGWKQLARGHRAAALRSWRRAARTARGLGMQYEQARSYEQLVRFSTDPAEVRRSAVEVARIRSLLGSQGRAPDPLMRGGSPMFAQT